MLQHGFINEANVARMWGGVGGSAGARLQFAAGGETPMSWKVTNVEALPNFHLRVAFADGLSGTVNMSRLIHAEDAGVFAVLADPRRFAEVFILHGAVSWPGGIDLAPDAMHDAIEKHGVWTI